jgi:GNAT superfamily N-acetyltransferase
MEMYTVTTEKSMLDVGMITDFLLNRSYWAKARSKKIIEKSIENSLCFGVYTASHTQIGFARVVSDFAVFAWLMDVFILEEHRGNGLGVMLMKEMMTYPALQDVTRWGLGIQDAHGLYQKFGFQGLLKPENMMELVK